MKLQKDHRQGLIDALITANEEIDIFKEVIKKHQGTAVAKRFEIKLFLEQQKVVLIQNILIENEINL
jgi:hypothetical protein